MFKKYSDDYDLIGTIEFNVGKVLRRLKHIIHHHTSQSTLFKPAMSLFSTVIHRQIPLYLITFYLKHQQKHSCPQKLWLNQSIQAKMPQHPLSLIVAIAMAEL